MAGLNQAEWADFWLEVSLSAGIRKKMQNMFYDQEAYVHLWWNSRTFWLFRLTLAAINIKYKGFGIFFRHTFQILFHNWHYLDILMHCGRDSANAMPSNNWRPKSMTIVHSWEIIGFWSIKCSSETLQNLLYFMYF